MKLPSPPKENTRKVIFRVTVSTIFPLLRKTNFWMLKILRGRTTSKKASYLTKFGVTIILQVVESAVIFICLFGVLRRFQHCTGHITTGSWKGRGNQYIQLVKVLYCKLPTNSKQLPAFPLEAVPGIEPWPQRWEARVLPLCHRGPQSAVIGIAENGFMEINKMFFFLFS